MAKQNTNSEHTRTDTKTKAIVDKALELEALLGPTVAAGLMANKNVPFEVARRVLRQPKQRRQS